MNFPRLPSETSVAATDIEALVVDDHNIYIGKIKRCLNHQNMGI
jgi:hypothetical protein